MMQLCFICKGNIADSTTNYMIDLGDSFIINKNVPCHKCTQCVQCGEVSFSGTTASHLDAIVEELKDVFTEVAVVDFAA